MGGAVLSGGFVSTVTRRGDEVHRSMAERHEYVHELLRFLAECGWHGAPQLLRVEPPRRSRPAWSRAPGWCASCTT
ncbi:hypothetical protein [Promicromonospora soli]